VTSAPPNRADRLVTGRFVLVVVAGLAYFLALGVVLPVVPQYVEQELGGGSLEIGVAVGALFVGAVLLRPYVGRLGDRTGRRLLIVVGAAIVAVSVFLYGAVESLPFLVGARVLTGLGEAAFFVGAATMITDLAPESRRGEAISYWSVAVYGGLAFGPVIGEAALEGGGYGAVWVTAGLLAAAATVLSFFTREVERPTSPSSHGEDIGKEPIINRAAVGPGAVLFSGLIALAAFSAFVPLYVDEVGLGSADVVFLLYGCFVLVVRIFGARIPDRLGGRVAGACALACTATGMAVMAGWSTTAGLLLGTVFLAAGASLLYPALLLLALGAAPETERASVVGTFSSFFDLSQGLGSLIVGSVAALTSYQGAFAAGSAFAVVGFLGLWFHATRLRRRAHMEEAGALAVEHPGP
jgi:MFS family permease